MNINEMEIFKLVKKLKKKKKKKNYNQNSLNTWVFTSESNCKNIAHKLQVYSVYSKTCGMHFILCNFLL